MAIVDLPDFQWFRSNECEMILDDIRFMSSSAFTRRTQDRKIVGSSFWRGHLVFVPTTHAHRADLEGFLDTACLPGNLVRMGHPIWRTPRGTATGSITVSGTYAAGVTQFSLSGTNGQTFLRGDLIGPNDSDQILRVQEDVTFSGGAALVKFQGNLRATVNSGTAIVLSWPKALFRFKKPSIIYSLGVAQEVTVEFNEEWL